MLRDLVGRTALSSTFFLAVARSPPDLLRFSRRWASALTREEALDVELVGDAVRDTICEWGADTEAEDDQIDCGL